MLVVDGGGSLNTALMGDMIAGAAVANGWAGVVINGPIRDRAAVAKLPLGVKALGSNPRKSAKDSAGEVDVPVEFGGVTFRPGAVLYADEDGILVEPGNGVRETRGQRPAVPPRAGPDSGHGRFRRPAARGRPHRHRPGSL